MCLVTWLIWATYNPFPKISENKTENSSETTQPRKISRGCVFYILFYIIYSKISENAKHIGYLIKSRLIVFKLIIDRKLKL